LESRTKLIAYTDGLCSGVAHDQKLRCTGTRSPTSRRRLQAILPKQKAGPEAIRGDRLFIEGV